MLRSLQRLPLRRCVHTSTTRPMSALRSSRVGMAVGASAVLTGYVGWRTFQSQNTISLDSVTTATKPAPLTVKASASPEATTTSHSATLQHESLLEELPEDSAPESQPEPPSAPEATEGTEDSEGTGGAFNPVTGEINWDCPCLGGMAHGTCGAQFREAFSCFVFSEKEPKGIDCVEKFKLMQDCFREHPEEYGDEIMDEDDEDDAPAVSGETAPVAHVTTEPERQSSPTIPAEYPLTSKDTPSPA